MMAALTILSISLFAQNNSKSKMKASKQKSGKVTYSCPMHPDMVMNKPGQCPICGAKLGLSPKEQMKMEVMKIYSCPMHPDVTSSKPGKCPKCGMDLTVSKNE